MINVYIAAPWIKGGDALELKKKLEESGFVVASRWLDRVKGNLESTYDYTKDPNYTLETGRQEAEKDIMDIARAHYVVVLNSTKSEGKAVEQGIALAWKTPVLVIGNPTNTFHYLPEPKMRIFIDSDSCIKWLLEREKS